MLKYKLFLKFTPKRPQLRNYIEPAPPFGLTRMCKSKHLIPNYTEITITPHNKQCHNTKKAKKKCVLYCNTYTVVFKT